MRETLTSPKQQQEGMAMAPADLLLHRHRSAAMVKLGDGCGQREGRRRGGKENWMVVGCRTW
jgi:hypothetical protein